MIDEIRSSTSGLEEASKGEDAVSHCRTVAECAPHSRRHRGMMLSLGLVLRPAYAVATQLWASLFLPGAFKTGFTSGAFEAQMLFRRSKFESGSYVEAKRMMRSNRLVEDGLIGARG